MSVLFEVLIELCQLCQFCVCSNLKHKFTNKLLCRKGCKHRFEPKNGSEIAFQASVWFLLGFETNVGISIY